MENIANQCEEFNFTTDFFIGHEIDLEKLSRIDLNKEEKAKKFEKIKKEMRQKTKNKRKESKIKKREDRKKILNQMTYEERVQYYNTIEEKDRAQQNNLIKGMSSDYTVVFDLDYVDFMKLKEIKSLANQLGNCYNMNKKFKFPFRYYLCSYENDIQVEMEAMGSHNWHVNYKKENFTEIDEVMQSGKQLVYLSPDSSEILTEINSNSIYIIGGFVDKPVSKWRSLYKAKTLNIKTARLPLDDYIVDLANPVLNVNTVVEILGAYLEDGNFNRIQEIIPKRMTNK